MLLTQKLTAATFRLALVQYEIKGGQSVESVLEKMSAAIADAKAKNAELVVFPELTLLDMWPVSTKGVSETKLVKKIALEAAPKIQEQMVALAKKHSIYILAGSMPTLRRALVYNTAFLASPEGKTFVQDKVYLTKWERDVGIKSGGSLKTFSLPFAKIAILICYDVEFPINTQALVKDQPELILVPSMTESQHGMHRVRWTAQARAVEHHAYVAIASTVGKPSSDWEHFGESAVLTPREGDFPGVLAQAKLNKADLIVTELDFEKLRASRKQSEVYPAKDQKTKFAK